VSPDPDKKLAALCHPAWEQRRAIMTPAILIQTTPGKKHDFPKSLK
jgi:hypothetical protein